jgi:hypothetical protein
MDKHAYITYLHQAVAALETSLTTSANMGSYPGSEEHEEVLRDQFSETSKELTDVLTEPEISDYSERREALERRVEAFAAKVTTP